MANWKATVDIKEVMRRYEGDKTTDSLKRLMAEIAAPALRSRAVSRSD